MPQQGKCSDYKTLNSKDNSRKLFNSSLCFLIALQPWHTWRLFISDANDSVRNVSMSCLNYAHLLAFPRTSSCVGRVGVIYGKIKGEFCIEMIEKIFRTSL